jgi:hypothetical protein
LFGAFSWAGIGVVGGGGAGFSFGAFSWTVVGVVGSGDGGFSFGAFSWTVVGVFGGGDSGFSFGAFSWTGIGELGCADAGFSFGASSWTGIGVVGGGDAGFSFGAFSWSGIGVVGGGDGGLLFGALRWALGRAPNFWKYRVQVVDSSMRLESRHFKTSLSLRAPAQSLCMSGPHDARRMFPIVALPIVTGAADCVTGLCAFGLEVSPRSCLAAIIFPHAADNSLVWDDRH